MFTRVKGTQDFLDLTLFNFLIDSTKKHLALYNFTEISTPLLEPLELFKRTLGAETDVVTKEMYTVNTGSDDESICLRPEGTAGVVRAFVNNNIQQTPWKVFECGPMFRHERPQKGRYREFHQITMEIVGSKAIEQDAQFIKMLDRFFHEVLTLDTYGLLINFLGCPADRAAFKEILYKFLQKHTDSICATCVIRKEKNILRVFDCKNPQCQEIYKQAPHIADHLCEVCAQEWQLLKDNLEQLSVSYSYVPTLVRGLDYYDKTVFEFVSMSLGAQNAFCSGGRYNQLAREIGSKEDQPSVGAAMGLERLVLMLDEIKDRLQLPVSAPLQVIVPFAQEQYALALLIADELQAHAIKTDILLEGNSLKSNMRQANKMQAQHVLLIGPDEQEQKVVTVKNMLTGNEQKIAQSALVKFLSGN